LLREILLLGFVSVLLAALLGFPVRLMSRWMPRGVATLFTLVAVLAFGVGLAIVFAPRVVEGIEAIGNTLPQALEKLRSMLGILGTGTAKGVSAAKVVDRGSAVLIPVAKGAVGIATACILVFFLSAFLVYQPATYVRGARKLIPRDYERIYDESIRRLDEGLRHWLGGIFIAMLLMGSFAAVGLALAGIHDWAWLGALIFVGTFVPYVGAVTSAVPGLLMGFSQSPRHLLWACVVYLGVHIVEGYVVQPFIMRRAVELKPAVLLLGQVSLATLFGLPGAVVAAPLLVCSQILVDYLYVERRLQKGEPESPRRMTGPPPRGVLDVSSTRTAS
jgi:predicted PurR-regulated permease PerM